jgi:hypothetical protein
VEDYDLWLRVSAQFPFVYMPGDVAAIRRHRESISRDVAALRKRDLLVLAKMDGLYPDLMRQFRTARHEAYARNHGAIAAAQFQQGQIAPGLAHGIAALSHALRMPGFGLQAFVKWRGRRGLRRGARS